MCQASLTRLAQYLYVKLLYHLKMSYWSKSLALLLILALFTATTNAFQIVQE